MTARHTAKVVSSTLRAFVLRHHVWLLFTASALLILAPLLRPGYTLVVDMVFAPRITLPAFSDHTFPFYLLLVVSNYVLPGWVIQKIVLLAIFITAGLGGYRLVRSFIALQASATSRIAPYFGGLLYVFNPFVYTRLMAGQYLFLIGYALLPFFIITLYAHLRVPNRTNSLKAVAVLGAIGAVSLHVLGMCLLVAIAMILCLKPLDLHYLKTFAQRSALALALFAVCSLHWVAPLLLGKSSVSTTVDHFTAGNDLSAFSPSGEALPTPLNLLFLHGFWADQQSLYVLAKDAFSWWLLPLLAVLGLVIVGIAASWRAQRRVTLLFLTLLVIGLFGSLGISFAPFAPLSQWSYDHIPLLAGYREPQKLLALLIISYAYFSSFGIAHLGQKFHKPPVPHRASWAILLLPVLCAPLLPWGANGQLRSAHYPDDWSTVNKIIGRNEHNYAAFLPWHLYMPFSFSSGLAATPAKHFFDTDIVVSNDPEFNGASGYSTIHAVTVMDRKILPNARSDPDLAKHLLQNRINYIILAKDFDYKNYDYFSHKANIKPVFESDTVILYRIEKD